METAEAFWKVGEYLRTSGADEDVIKAFDILRNSYTRMVGQVMLMSEQETKEEK